ncbi:MAG: ATP-binding protein [Pseudomonadota bacterium]
MNTKRKLIWQIFPSFLIITLLSLTAVTLYSTSHIKTVFLDNLDKELTIRTKILQNKFIDILKSNSDQIIQPDQMLRIDQQCKEIGKETGTRVTVVLPSGVVVGDSFGDIQVMENHMQRPEINQALKKIKGISIRYSATLDKNMMYVALPVLDNNTPIGVIRTAVSIRAIDQNIKTIRNNIFLVLVMTTLAAAIVSLYVTRRITRPIEEMKKGAAQFANGKLDVRLAVPSSEELSELAVTMNQMAENLDEKIKAFKHRSMELEAVHGSMLEGVIAIDKDERIITVNSAAAKIFDFPAAQLKTRYILEVARNVEFQSFIQRALATHEPVEDDIILKEKESLVLNIHSTALYDTNRQRMGTLIMFHDITRIRRLETMHKDFAANVSHELKTPLTTIKGFIETLQEMLVSKDTKQSEYFLNIIDKNVNRMIDLINDLLALSRLERLEGTGIRFEQQPLHALLQAAIHMCQSGISEKQIQVSIDCPEELIVKVDPGLMEQAMINLVDNAVKYSPQNSHIMISARLKENRINIVIQDQGCGIDQDHLPKIFNRFYRVDKSRSRHEGGTGLGLAIVKHIVQYHQGTIVVQSVKNQGTCFKISLPG